ncbi:MAG: hypothetical protein ABIT76_13600 [Chthoniobacterales bacterium]
MARKKIQRSLSPLTEVFSDFVGFTGNDSQQVALIRLLEFVSKQQRREHSQPFYSMREITDFFHVPLRTVALSYEALERKGLLIRIRGSQTLLSGRAVPSRREVRAVVGVPVRLHTFVASPYSRSFYVELEEGLRRSGFVADLIFYRGEEVERPEFTERLIHHRLDSVLWHTPPPAARSAILSLRDLGVQQILIQPTDCVSDILLPTYLQDWQAGYEELARKWKEIGIRHVVFPKAKRSLTAKAERTFLEIFAAAGISGHFFSGQPTELSDLFKRLERSGIPALAFIDQEGSDSICNGDPLVLEDLIQRYRVAFCRGILRIPYFHRKDVKVDVVMFSAGEMAACIADDVRRMPIIDHVIRTFKATYKPQVSLRSSIEAL